jgi:hypothetical protein
MEVWPYFQVEWEPLADPKLNFKAEKAPDVP